MSEYYLVEDDGRIGASHYNKKDAEIMAMDYRVIYGVDVKVVSEDDYKKEYKVEI